MRRLAVRVRLGRTQAAAMCPKDGGEGAELVPADDELAHVLRVVRLDEAAAVAANVGGPPGDARHGRVHALRHLRRQLLEARPDVGRPEDGPVPLPSRPHAACEEERRQPRLRHRLREGAQPVVDPQVRVRGGRPEATVVAVVPVAAAAGALAVRLVQPEGAHALVKVARLEQCFPQVAAALWDRRIDGAPSEVRVDEAATLLQRRVLCRLAEDLGPERKHEGRVDGRADAVREGAHGRVAGRVGGEVAVVPLVLVVDDQHRRPHCGRPLGVLRRDAERDARRLVPIARLPEPHRRLAQRRRVAGRVRVLPVQRRPRWRIGARRHGGDPKVEVQGRARSPV
mmetsp:Transcript_41154/g.132807  ORF Transcript_41154/g.132807 Transcript_41154/m.132807 type:complete len:341 (-) Transcript_41154:981-2003(-)